MGDIQGDNPALRNERKTLRDLPGPGVLSDVGPNLNLTMKLIKYTTALLLAATFIAAPMAGFAETKTMDESALMQPVKSVLDHYLMIQADLAKDSIKGLSDHTSAISKAVSGDSMKMLSFDVAKQAETLGKTKDIKSAREAFKPLSNSLIKYLADNKAGKGTYHEAYCPMVKASWLQTEKEIKNPYLGSGILTCGTLKN